MYTATRQPDDVAELVIHTGEQTQELLMAAGDRTLEANYSLIRSAQEHLPQALGFELVEVSQLGSTPAVTACLLDSSATTYTSAVSPPSTALQRYLETLIDNRLPHVVQIIVRNDGADRQVSLRAALYDPDVQWVSDADYATTLDDGTFDPATYFTDDVITSSWRLPLEGTWSVSKDVPLVGHDDAIPRLYLDTDQIRDLEYDADHRPDARQRLARSPDAFDALRERAPSPSRLRAYTSFDVDPWLTVDAETLPAFLEHVPAYYDHDLWPAVPGWKRFEYSVESVLREAPGTTPATTNAWTPPPVDPLEKLDIDDADEHTQAAAAWFLTRGTLRRPRAFPSATFEIFRNGRSRPVLVVTEETLSAGDLIELVSDAARAGTTAYVVADTDATARHIATLLLRPFRESTPTRTRLYTTTQRLEVDGQWAVHPESYDDPEWWWTPGDTLELWAGDTCLARRPRTLETASLIESLPHCRRVDNAYVVSDANGNHITRAPTTEALAASWTPLPPPVTPAFLATGTQYATVLTPTTNGFREYHHHPAWIDTDDPRYRSPSFTTMVVERFLDQYTAPADPDTLTIDQLFPQLCTWLRTIDPYGFEFDLAPDDVAHTMDTDRQWRYPLGDQP
ncbi:uncharacterized protein HBSAL_06265 [Halobacterium salinarum]|uniref:Uncharacterized protein n=1 Tax=Halobacterium salinarum (strain ATCC 33171 / DSM 3754 / JCM 8978 / NBRC 102687 / NCIMB 764 / 91-R6) TaxID=2597657 RepID=A0A4D6GTL1_HALS9|nr:uncharacterized protein HBSAL_06265 [Halobacterium salinarum]